MIDSRIGTVVFYKADKEYGFIEDNEDKKSYFFIIHNKEQIALRRAGHFPIAFIRKGDIMKFQIRESDRKPKEKDAHNLIFIGNKELDKIKTSIDSGNPRFGKIVYMRDNYYLVDNEYEIVFPIKHSDFINDINILFKAQSVRYFLEQRKNPTKIFARLFISEANNALTDCPAEQH